MPPTKLLPIFAEYSLSALAERMPMYEESYLLQIKKGYDKPTDKFKLTAAAILNRSIAELFGTTDEAGEG